MARRAGVLGYRVGGRHELRRERVVCDALAWLTIGTLPFAAMELSEQQWLLVHEVRLRGLVDVATLGDAPGVAELVACGVMVAKGNLVALTETGRQDHATWARVADGTVAHATLARFHGGFHELNRELLAVCTAWQVLPSGALNDHRDPGHDWKVIDRLQRLHERAAPRIDRVADDVERFASYATRLRCALRKIVVDGITEWLTGTRVDSYHTVWNQMHEDVLLAMGRDRSAEPQP